MIDDDDFDSITRKQVEDYKELPLKCKQVGSVFYMGDREATFRQNQCRQIEYQKQLITDERHFAYLIHYAKKARIKDNERAKDLYKSILRRHMIISANKLLISSFK